MTTLNNPGYRATPKATFSIPSILAIVCAIGSFVVHSGTATLLLAIGAALFGIIGVVVALLPHVRGGIISVLSIAMGAIGLITAIVRFMSTNNTTP